MHFFRFHLVCFSPAGCFLCFSGFLPRLLSSGWVFFAFFQLFTPLAFLWLGFFHVFRFFTPLAFLRLGFFRVFHFFTPLAFLWLGFFRVFPVFYPACFSPAGFFSRFSTFLPRLLSSGWVFFDFSRFFPPLAYNNQGIFLNFLIFHTNHKPHLHDTKKRTSSNVLFRNISIIIIHIVPISISRDRHTQMHPQITNSHGHKQ